MTIARALGLDVAAEADPEAGVSLTYTDFIDAVHRLRAVDFPIERPVEEAWASFVGWRVNYEAAAYAIARRIDAPPALWSGARRREMEPIPPLRPNAGRRDDGGADPA